MTAIPTTTAIRAAVEQMFTPDVSLTETLPGKWQPSVVRDIPLARQLNGGLSACVTDIDAFIRAAGIHGLTVETISIDNS